MVLIVNHCKGKCRNGAPCSFKGRYDGYCKKHLMPMIECPICYDETRDFFMLPCKHKYHKECISTWLGMGNRNCPMCRVQIDQKTLHTLGIPPPDFCEEVIKKIENFILSTWPEYTEFWATENYSMISRYKKCAKSMITILHTYIIVRNDIISFLDVRLFNKRGRQERDRLLREINIILERITRIKNEIINIQTDNVTTEMGVLLRDSMLSILRYNEWR